MHPCSALFAFFARSVTLAPHVQTVTIKYQCIFPLFDFSSFSFVASRRNSHRRSLRFLQGAPVNTDYGAARFFLAMKGRLRTAPRQFGVRYAGT